jgi:aminopeptidase N
MEYSNLQFMRTLLRSVIAFTAIVAFADNYPRQPGIDAQHYIFRVVLSDDTDEIHGEATIDLRFLREGITQVALDLASPKDGKGMSVTELTMAGAPVRYVHAADRLVLTLPAAPDAGDRRQFTIKYHGTPATGLHIGKNKFGERTFFSWNWPTLARQWLPLIDHPYDKATSEFLITAPSKYQVVANGLLSEETDLGDGRRLTHWKQSVPIASWLNNIGVAQFAVRHFAVDLGVPLETWVFHQDRDNGVVTFETPMRQAIEFFSAYIGPYPYERLASVQVSGLGGGMEHASAVFYGERSVTAKPAFSLIAHEISHQWWGDSVTEKDWDDAWLSEGFATYFAALASEHYESRDAFVNIMKRSRAAILQMEKRTPNMAVIHDNLPEIQNGRAPAGIVYQKGGWTLHMLRGLIGADKFQSGMREYYKRYRDGNASTGDFRQVMEETTGKDLAWFFQQWLERSGSPCLEGYWTYDADSRKVRINLSQTQRGGLYRLPVEIGIMIPDQAVTIHKIELSGATQQYEFAAEKVPSSVEVDPNVWLLADTTFIRK